MKVAYFSPFLPKQTGIALYSEQLVAALRQLVQVDCYDFWNDDGGEASVTFADFARSGRVTDLLSCDAVVYHLGNNPHFHLEIFKVLRQFRGMVVLHDVVLYYLFAGLGRAGLIKHLWLNYGRDGAAKIEEIVDDSPEHDILRYRYPEKYPLTASIFASASRIVVHNRSARDHLVALGYTGAVHVIPMLSYTLPRRHQQSNRVAQLVRKHSITDGQVIIGCLGFIGPTKRIDKVCEALRLLRGHVDFRLLIVGEGDDVGGMIADAGLGDVTIRTAFVDEADFSGYLSLTDIVINLRYPSMGESSATLIQAMALAKPCIVTNHGSFADLPAETVEKINLGENEVTELASAIEGLASDSARRSKLGAAALRYTQSALDPSSVARQFVRVFETEAKERAQNALIVEARHAIGQEAIASTLAEAITRSVPPHLRALLIRQPQPSQ